MALIAAQRLNKKILNLKIIVPTPLVFIVHDGNQEYVTHSIDAAMQSSHATTLIGNEFSFGALCSNFISSDEVDLPRFDRFRRQYKHLSSNPYNFELQCFKRFYLLEQCAKTMGANEFWMIDSDVLLIENLSETQAILLKNGYVAALSTEVQKSRFTMASCPHISFWTLSALSDFVDFLDHMYEKYAEILESKYKHQQENQLQGGVCDMTALFLWSKTKNIFNTSRAYLDGFPFDHQINQSTNFDDDEFDFIPMVNLKKVVLRNDINYVYSKKLKSYVRVACLHFQGGSKVSMGKFMRKRAITMRTEFFGVKHIQLARIKGAIINWLGWQKL